MSKIVEIAESILEPFLKERGFELYFAEYVKEGRDKVLRIVIDKEGGVDSDDCAEVSRHISSALDEIDPIPDAYLLEVSSPGIERELRKQQHFDRNLGKRVNAALFKAFEGRKSYEGMLVEKNDKELTINTDERVVKIPAELVSRVKLVFNFE